MCEKIKKIIFYQQHHLKSCSKEIVQLERTVGCNGKPVWKKLREFSNNQIYPFLKWKHPSEIMYRYHLQDVIIDAYYMVFFQQGQVIPDGNPFIGAELLNSIHICSEKLIDAYDQGPVFCCSDHWENNYYHWMIHAIPAYFAAMNSGIKGKFLLPYPLMVWRKRSLELLGLDLSLCYPIEKDKQYRFSEVYYFDHTFGKADFSRSKLSCEAYNLIKENVVLSQQWVQPYEKIYISRLGKENRHLSNENELINALQKRGYFILDPESYSLDEQIMLFHHAKIVVGLLGAGLSNIVFCQKGTLVYELIPSHHNNPCFLALSLQSELNYWADQFDTGVRYSGPDHLSAWEKPIDIDFVLGRLDELEPYMRSVK